MPAPPKIPPKLKDDLLRMRGAGKIAAELREWLSAEHGIEVTLRGVQRYLERIDKERAPIARAVAIQELTGKVVADLDGFEGIIKRAERDERASEKKVNYADVEKTLVAIATAKLGDYFQSDGSLKPMSEWTEDQHLAAESVKIREVTEESETDDGAPMKKTEARVVALKLRDSEKASVDLVAVRERKVARELAMKSRDQQAKVRATRLEMAGAGAPRDGDQKRVVVLPAVRPVEQEPETQPITH